MDYCELTLRYNVLFATYAGHVLAPTSIRGSSSDLSELDGKINSAWR